MLFKALKTPKDEEARCDQVFCTSAANDIYKYREDSNRLCQPNAIKCGFLVMLFILVGGKIK